MDLRMKAIARILYEENKVLNSTILARKLGVSLKTIQSLIKDNQDLFANNGFQIKTSLLGYRIIIENDTLFHMFIYDDGNEKDTIMNSIIIQLLDSQDYLKISDIADGLYISRATADRMIKKIKDIFLEYQLDIVSRSKYGIKVNGSEFNKRLCYAYYSEVDTENMGIKVQKILFDVFENFSFEMNDHAFHALCLHICIMMRRIACGNELKELIDMADYPKEEQIAESIVLKLQQEFQLIICDAEQSYIVMHLLGKQIYTNPNLISIQVFKYIDKILDDIKQVKNIDLHNDLELRTVLAMHIQPMLQRVKFNIKQKNPLLNHIKREMIGGYELALIAGERLKQEGLWEVLDEDEMSYLALHFSLALEKDKKNLIKTKILIVCASGKGTSQLIQYRLMNRYHFDEQNLVLTSMLKLENIDLSEFGCIMSTIPLKRDYPIPVIMIDPIMTDRSMKRIDDFMNSHILIENLLKHSDIKEELIFYNQNMKSKEEVLSFMCNQIEDIFGVNYYCSILERESLNSTEVGNNCCLPHPMENHHNHLVLSILTLKESIKWTNTNVKYVFLMILPDSQVELSRLIIKGVSYLSSHPDLLYELEFQPSIRKVFQLMFEE